MSLRARLERAVGESAASYGGDYAVSTEIAAPGRVLTDAAVLIAVVDRDAPTLLLTRRSAHLRRHPGQVAFPGGRIDPGDASAVAAALREAHEEIALAPGEVDVVGETDRYETGTGYAIVPVLAVVPPDLPLAANPAEVAAIFEVDFEHVLDAANHQRRRGEWQGKERHFYVIEADGVEIWGATAAMLVNLSRRLA